MRNLDWTMHFCEYIYEMKLIEAREQVYLMNFKRSNEDGMDPLECIVELSTDEIEIIHERPDLTFEYIYNDKNGSWCFILEYEFDASKYNSVEDTIEALYDWENYDKHRKRIFSLEDLVHWRFFPCIKLGTNGAVQNPNKVRKIERVYLEPNEGEKWLKDNSSRIMNEMIRWAAEHLEIFKRKEEEKCSDTTSTNNSENTSEKSE